MRQAAGLSRGTKNMSGLIQAVRGAVNAVARAAVLGVAIALTALAVPAFAQSAGCNYINGGGLNHTVRFAGGVVSNTGTTARVILGASAYHSMQAAAGYSDPTFGTTGFSGGPYPLASGDIVHVRATTTNATNLPATITAAIAGGSGGIAITGNGVETLNYPVVSASQLGLYTYRQDNGMSADIAFVVTCTPAPAPTLSFITPVSGPEAGGTSVTVNGANFVPSQTSVTIGGVTIPAGGVTVNSPTSLTFSTPAHGAGNVAVTVTAPGGTTAPVPGGFTYVGAPTISAISPAEGAASATTPPANVTLSGTNFSASGNTVTFAGTAGTVVSESATSITVTPPARAAGGLVNVVVTNANSVSATATNAYRYLLPPTVTVSFGSTSVTGTQGTSFSVTVTNPNDVAIQNVTVASNGANTPFILTAFGTFCGSSGNYNASSAFRLSGINLAAGASCTASSTQQTSSAGAFQFVTNAPTSTGTAATAVTLTGVPATSNTVTAYQTPFISIVTPSSGLLSGGTSITITGQRFFGSTGVTVDGVAATNVVVLSDTMITAITPAGSASGSKTVSVTGPGGTGSRTNGFLYNALPTAPSITAPTNGAVTSAIPTYSGTVTTSGQTVTAYVDGVSIGTASVSGLTWTLQQPTALAEGSHTIHTTSTTVAGGTSVNSATTTFTVDATPPAQPTIVQPFPMDLQTRTPTLTGTAETGGTVTVYANNNPIGTTTASGGAWSFNTATLADGSYAFRVTVTDPYGNVSQSSGVAVLNIDNVAPAAATITAPIDGLVTNGNPTFSGTGEPGSFLEFRFNGDTYLTGLQVPVSGVWSFTFPGMGLGNGTYVFAVAAMDAAGNAASVTTGPTFTIDRSAPAFPTLTSPAPGTTTSNTTPTLSGAAETGAVVTIYLNDNFLGQVTAAGGIWSYPITAPLPDADYQVKLMALDTAFNSSGLSPAIPFRLDATPPAAPVILTPVSGAQLTSGSVTITGTAEAGTAVNIGLGAGAMVAATVDGSGNWTFTYGALADGSHTVRVVSQDLGGNISADASVTFGVDANAPAIPVITAPADGALTSDNTPILSGTAEPNATVTVTLDGGALPSFTADGSGVWTVTTATLADGAHAFHVTATDGFGNVSTASTAVNFTVDATAPATPVITTPADGSVTNIARPALSGTAEDGATVTLTLNGASATLTATGGVWSYVPTTDLNPGSNTVQVTATDAVGNVSSAASISFTYSPVTIATTSLPAGQVGAVYAGTIAIDGGATPYAFAVTSGALPDGVTLSSGGQLSGTPTVSGTFNFTVTVTEANSLTDDQTYTVTITAPAVPDADPETVVVPATASTGPTPVDLSGSVQNAASIEIVTPPAQGSVTVNGLSVIYTPQPGFFGTVTFTYKAIGFSDGNGAGAESAPATVTITLAAPTLTLGGGALAAGQIAQPYSETFAASGGTAPYTYAITAGALPSGVTLASDGTLSGSPTAGGTFNFTITATDSSTGTGPFSISGTYSLAISAPAMSVTPAALPSATVAQAYSQSFAAAGGVAPYTYAVTAGALPAGLTLASNGALSGTPTAGGTFNFTVTATDSSTGAGPYTASQAVTLTVNGSTIAVTPTALAGGTRGVAYSQSVSATGGVAPYTYTVASGALPAGLTLSPQGVIAGTPTAVGAFTFGVRATDSATGAGPYQGVATVTLTVSAAAITVTPTSLPQVLAGTPFSQQMQASGGQGGYTYSLTNSGLPTGLTLSSSGLISGRPQISGVFNFTVTARDGFGNTGSVALSLTVNGRPDPSADADVRGLSTAQAEATRRMAGNQLELFHRRLEALHTASGAAQVDLRLNLDGNAFTPLDANRASMGELAQATGQAGLDGRDLSGRGELTRMMDARRPDAAETAQGAPGPANGSVQAGGLRIWAGGAISLGERDATSQTSEFRIHTSGVSAGADMRITDTLDLGLGVGYGQERTEVGDADSRMDADSWVGVAYGSWRPAESLFIDGVLGYGQMSFDTRRTTPVDSSLVTGDRDGTTWFGSVSAGVDRTFGPARWISYGRLEAMNASLDAYTETGSPVWALSYDARELDSLQGTLGLRYERQFVREDYTWTPGLRVEWRQEFSEGGVQTLRYADWLNGPAYAIDQEGWGRSELNLGLTFDFKGADGWSFSTGADTRLSDEQWMASMKLLISKVF